VLTNEGTSILRRAQALVLELDAAGNDTPEAIKDEYTTWCRKTRAWLTATMPPYTAHFDNEGLSDQIGKVRALAEIKTAPGELWGLQVALSIKLERLAEITMRL
jgi:hypothetical protein